MRNPYSKQSEDDSNIDTDQYNEIDIPNTPYTPYTPYQKSYNNTNNNNSQYQ